MREDWDHVREDRASTLTQVGFGALRAALLFGSAAIALALIATPLLDRSMRAQGTVVSLDDSLDMTATGSTTTSPIGRRTVPEVGTQGGRYTIRRSVLQSSPDAVCIIRASGSRIGDC